MRVSAVCFLLVSIRFFVFGDVSSSELDVSFSSLLVSLLSGAESDPSSELLSCSYSLFAGSEPISSQSIKFFRCATFQCVASSSLLYR